MNQENKNAASSGENAAFGLEDLGQMFAPDWTRQESGVAVKKASYERDRPRDNGKPRRERSGEGARDRKFSNDRKPPRKDFDKRRQEGRPSSPRPNNYRENKPREVLPPLDLNVRFLPEQKSLSAIIRRVQVTHKAYPIRDLVKLFQNNDESLMVRIEPSKTATSPEPIYQCRVCGMPALSQDEVIEHLQRKHLEDFFDVETVEGEAPTGIFNFVARCGLSGELLGPPNHHSYMHRVREMIRDRYPQMTEEEYLRHVETVRDSEVVEQWREAAKTKQLFRLKQEEEKSEKPRKAEEQPKVEEVVEGEETPAEATETPVEEVAEEKAPAMERHEAELYFRREFVPQQVGAAPHVTCPATALSDLPNRQLATLLNVRFAEEAKRHGSLFFAVHGALRHRGLYLFRAGDSKGPEFVMHAEPTQLDVSHVTPELREIVEFVERNPSCPAQDLLEEMAKGDEDKQKRLSSDIQWLVEKGHLVEYFNGFLSTPAKHPIFKTIPPKKMKKPVAQKPEAEASEEVAEASSEEIAPVENTEVVAEKPEEVVAVAEVSVAEEAPLEAAPEVTEESPAVETLDSVETEEQKN